MTDTNQLPPSDHTGTQALWPQMIQALAEIDRALGLPDDGCNSLEQTLSAIRALQSRAQLAQGEPVTDEQKSSIRLACEMLDSYIECIKASGEYELWHYIPQVEIARDHLSAILALRPADGEQERELRRSLEEARATISQRNAEIVELHKRLRPAAQGEPVTDDELDQADMEATVEANKNPHGTQSHWRKAYLRAIARAILALRPAAGEAQTDRQAREAEQRARMTARFTRRAPGEATADFDLPAPNDAIQQATPEPVGELLGYIPTDAIEQIKTPPRLITTNVPVLSYAAVGHTAIYTRPAPAAQAVPMTEDEFVACLVKANCVGVVKMSYDSGPYEVTRPSINASKLKEAFEAHHGITAQAKEVQS